jgi:hypothetical protein
MLALQGQHRAVSAIRLRADQKHFQKSGKGTKRNIRNSTFSFGRAGRNRAGEASAEFRADAGGGGGGISPEFSVQLSFELAGKFTASTKIVRCSRRRRHARFAAGALRFDGARFETRVSTLGIETVEQMYRICPPHKARYAMGLGTPAQMVELVARGVDMFDCVLPTRVARNGTAYTRRGQLGLKGSASKPISGRWRRAATVMPAKPSRAPICGICCAPMKSSVCGC